MMIKKLINVRPYTGSNKLICELRRLMKNSPDFIKNIIVHGSIATNEEILYSDFDGLIISGTIETAKSKRSYRKFIRDTLKLIYKTDPFQHHGWFILKENDFLNYPQTYFPHELFEHSRALGHTDLSFEIQVSDNINYYYPFYTIKDSILETINFNQPKNLYQLKSFLSRMMLMPCLYLQAKHSKGFNKKDSFNIAKNDFSESIWEPIEKASLIRNIWSYKLNPIQKYIMTRPQIFFRKLTKYCFSPLIPQNYKSILDKNFYDGSLALLKAMEEGINKNAD